MSTVPNQNEHVNSDSERQHDVEILRRAEAKYPRRSRVVKALEDFLKNNSGPARRGRRRWH